LFDEQSAKTHHTLSVILARKARSPGTSRLRDRAPQLVIDRIERALACDAHF